MATKPGKMDESTKKFLYIAGAVLSVGLAIFALNGLFTRNTMQVERAEQDEIKRHEREAKDAARKKAEYDAMVARTPLAPRPIRLFHEFVAAVARDNKAEINKLSDFGLDKYDLLMTEERIKRFSDCYANKRYKVSEEKLGDDKAVMAAVFKNQKGMDVEEMAFVMEHRPGGPENWKVVEIENRWYAASGNMPEKARVVLGADRTAVAAPILNESSFQVAPEADPTPQEWLAETDAARRTEITKQMKILLDDEHPAQSGKAAQELINIGKDAIPALLTELAKYDVRKDEDNKKANAIDRTLAAMTDREMGYDAIGLEGSTPPASGLTPAQARVRAVRRWFGWWGEHKSKPLEKRRTTTEVEDPRNRKN